MSDDPFKDGQNPFADRDQQEINPYASPMSTPPVAGGPPRSYPAGSVPNYLVQSILCLLCCCWPAAIPAIVFAAQVNGKLAAGDYAGAVQASNNAKTWCLVSFIGGLIVGVLYFFIAIAAEM